MQLLGGTAKRYGLPGLNVDCANDLPAIELSAESPTDILDGKMVMGDMELGVFP